VTFTRIRIPTARTCQIVKPPGAASAQVARDFWEDWPHANLGMVVEVADSSGQTVLTVPFAEAIDPGARR